MGSGDEYRVQSALREHLPVISVLGQGCSEALCCPGKPFRAAVADRGKACAVNPALCQLYGMGASHISDSYNSDPKHGCFLHIFCSLFLRAALILKRVSMCLPG